MFDKEHVGAFLWNRKTQDNEWGFRRKYEMMNGDLRYNL